MQQAAQAVYSDTLGSRHLQHFISRHQVGCNKLFESLGGLARKVNLIEDYGNGDSVGFASDKEAIDKYAAIFRKVIENYEQLLDNDADKKQGGRWYGMTNE